MASHVVSLEDFPIEHHQEFRMLHWKDQKLTTWEGVFYGQLGAKSCGYIYPCTLYE